ncbi:MAG TPA: hypothetical protein VE242_10850 [Chthoniobacterales bacterium]|nr:hypothetical protein [Chthoniobacterales bacterium]
MGNACRLFAASTALLLASAGIRLQAQAADSNLTLQSAGSTIHVYFPNQPPDPLKQAIEIWITKAATAVTNYYRRYPVPAVDITVNLRNRRGTGGGHASGWNGARIEIAVGRNTTSALFDDDWIMTHEMVHLAFPSVAEKHHWIEEGLATYVEPVARARVGQLTPEKIWADMVEGMPKGLPERDDRGLDQTPTWGRTYWGGAMFCLYADVEIRRRTDNEKGLEHAVRAILEKNGNIQTEAELKDLLATGDKATGVPALMELYNDWSAKPVAPDLDKLWKQLGVIATGDTVRFDDSAPLASVRRAITTGVAR